MRQDGKQFFKAIPFEVNFYPYFLIVLADIHIIRLDVFNPNIAIFQ